MFPLNTDNPAATSPLDDQFRLLAKDRRRDTIRVLAQQSSFSLDELARELAAVRGEPPDQVKIALYHTDLPVLADAGVLSYDSKNDEVVTVGPVVQDLTTIIEAADRNR